MSNLLPLMARHGYSLTFGILLAEAMGLPFPAAIALVAAGAAVASHTLWGPAILIGAVIALLLGDTAQFWLGRYMGWSLLGFLCRVSMNPETCILRSAESFYKRGKVTLMVAKFIPGVNTMAAPLAGSMKMRFWQFLRFDFVGALLYAFAYLTLGYLSRDFLAALLRGFNQAGRAMEAVVLVALIVYAVYRIVQYKQHGKYRVVPRIQVHELAARLASDEACKVQIVDCPVVTAITTPDRSGSKVRCALNPTIWKKRSSICPRKRTFTCTVLEHAKRPAPGWRTYCGKKDSTRS